MTDEQIPDWAWFDAAVKEHGMICGTQDHVSENNGRYVQFGSTEGDGCCFVTKPQAIAAMQCAEPEITDAMRRAIGVAVKETLDVYFDTGRHFYYDTLVDNICSALKAALSARKEHLG